MKIIISFLLVFTFVGCEYNKEDSYQQPAFKSLEKKRQLVIAEDGLYFHESFEFAPVLQLKLEKNSVSSASYSLVLRDGYHPQNVSKKIIGSSKDNIIYLFNSSNGEGQLELKIISENQVELRPINLKNNLFEGIPVVSGKYYLEIADNDDIDNSLLCPTTGHYLNQFTQGLNIVQKSSAPCVFEFSNIIMKVVSRNGNGNELFLHNETWLATPCAGPEYDCREVLAGTARYKMILKDEKNFELIRESYTGYSALKYDGVYQLQ